MSKQPAIAVGMRCIHTSKWEKRKCRVVAYDGTTVVVKMSRGGYVGVPEKSLTPEC
ncbi:hypothetical protein I5466_02850 [Citrobacter koseri]|uniref:hypothetical protein n=1 Tax=Citrobacter koseri TaxID=545 RepID=UPI001904EE42|nr:hypothetical protein [Citrobacter koseri]MBJ9119746.1 hypothetical protein [Citrobacter koseri]